MCARIESGNCIQSAIRAACGRRGGRADRRGEEAAGSAASESSAIQELREELAEQRKQLDELKLLLLDQKRQIDSLKTQASTVTQEDVPASVKPMRMGGIGEQASLSPVIPAAPFNAGPLS